MANIELVIKMPENTYRQIQALARDNYFERIIANGTPLPKGHGRIGDLDALRDAVSSWGMNEEPSDFIDAIDEAPTIIEADKE